MPVVTLDYTKINISDTSFSEVNPTVNYGTTNLLDIGLSGAGKRLDYAVFFDLGLIPNDVIINSATFNIYKAAGTAILAAHKITSAWEANIATWNTRPTFDPEQASLTTFTSANGYYNIDVKSIIQGLVNGDPNNGILLKSSSDTSYTTVTLATRENSTYRPTLTIDYTIPTTGKKQVEYVGAQTFNSTGQVASITPNLPTGVKAGDLLIAQIITGANSANDGVVIPSGWSQISKMANPQNLTTITYLYKFATLNEPNPTFVGVGSLFFHGAISAYRNVKQVGENIGRVITTASTQFSPTTGTATTAFEKTALVLFNALGVSTVMTHPLGATEGYDHGASATNMTAESSYRYLHTEKTVQNAQLISTIASNNYGESRGIFLVPISNNPPTLTLTNPADNQTLAEGNCEDTSKFTYTGGTASLDTTRKTQGNSSIKVTRNAANSYMTPTLTSIRPNVGDCYIAIADVYLENAAQANYLAGNGSDITRNEKYVTTTSGTGFPTTTTGQFVPIITAFQVTAVATPGTSYFRPRLFNDGAVGQSYNVDSFRVYKITQTQYDALGTNVDLATAQTIASQYPYFDLTLSEGKTIQVEGSATDADNGNVVTVKYKINNGTARALNSGVSNGSTPISFAKTLTYSSKRIWDGSTDVAGVDLAENTDHTLTLWAEDDQGGKSAEVTRKFQVVWNRPPSISGNDTNLGAIGTPPSINYTVTEPESDSFTITELLNGQQIRSFAGVAGQQNTATIDQDRWLRLALGVQHELRIRATDSKGQFADRIYTFTRTETQIQFDLKNPFFCDAKPTRVLVTLDGTFPDGSTVLVEVCNNAYDTVPDYEDATGPSLAGRGYIFTNETKTAADWGINIRITINKGTATEKVILNGFGGAFD